MESHNSEISIVRLFKHGEGSAQLVAAITGKSNVENKFDFDFRHAAFVDHWTHNHSVILLRESIGSERAS